MNEPDSGLAGPRCSFGTGPVRCGQPACSAFRGRHTRRIYFKCRPHSVQTSAMVEILLEDAIVQSVMAG